MAFTTELVARTGTLANLITTAVTTGGLGWSTTVVLPPGQWMVVVKGRTVYTALNNLRHYLTIDGADVAAIRGASDSTGRAENPTGMRIVTGGRTITVGAPQASGGIGAFRGTDGWDIYAARIPD